MNDRPTDASALHGLRLFVVEDDAFVAAMLEDLLAELGCVVVGLAGTLESALDLARAVHGRIDGAILDVNLGDDRVYPVADLLAKHGTKFIFATGYGRDGIDPRYAARPTLPKPFRKRELVEALTETLAPAAALPPSSALTET
jgi:CheY-like chemotaxis protein